MEKIFDITVIVPFYKRDSYALDIYKELDIQSTQNKIYTEVLFIDSYSRTTLEANLIEYKNGEYISYRVLDEEDYVSTKRNKGISESKTNFIVTIDDDCIPSENFLIGHFNKLKEFDYQGPFIMQAYRDEEGVEIFKKQLDWIKPYLDE